MAIVRITCSHKHGTKGINVSHKKNSIQEFYKYVYNQENNDIDRAVSTLKKAKTKNLKEKYKKYLEMSII